MYYSINKENDGYAKELGLILHETAAGCFVTSPRGHWVIQCRNGKFTLLHENTITNVYSRKNRNISKTGKNKKTNRSFHDQNKSFRSIEEALTYIKRHDEIRYTNDRYYATKTVTRMLRKVGA